MFYVCRVSPPWVREVSTHFCILQAKTKNHEHHLQLLVQFPFQRQILHPLSRHRCLTGPQTWQHCGLWLPNFFMIALKATQSQVQTCLLLSSTHVPINSQLQTFSDPVRAVGSSTFRSVEGKEPTVPHPSREQARQWVLRGHDGGQGQMRRGRCTLGFMVDKEEATVGPLQTRQK